MLHFLKGPVLWHLAEKIEKEEKTAFTCLWTHNHVIMGHAFFRCATPLAELKEFKGVFLTTVSCLPNDGWVRENIKLVQSRLLPDLDAEAISGSWPLSWTLPCRLRSSPPRRPSEAASRPPRWRRGTSLNNRTASYFLTNLRLVTPFTPQAAQLGIHF